MLVPIRPRADDRVPRQIDRWLFLVCELITVAALLATLVSIGQSSDGRAGRELLPAGTGPPDAYAACARFVEGGAMPAAGARDDGASTAGYSRLPPYRVNVAR